MEEKRTRIDFIVDLNLGPYTKRKEMIATMKKHLLIVPKVAFALVASSNETTAEDGKVLGEGLMTEVKERAKGTKKEDTVKKFVASNRPLTETTQKFSFFEPLLCAVVASKLCPVANVKTKAESCEEKDGKAIGKSLAISLATTLTATIGIDEWILQFPALQDLDSEYAWFRPMLESIAYKLVGEVGWGVKMRVALGATMSISDLATGESWR